MTLRSLGIGDFDLYFSPYNHGVAQGMWRLGHWHSQVNIRQSKEVIRQRLIDVQPHILWTHMYLWPPQGSPPVPWLIELALEAKRKWGTKVVLHDGDYKEKTRHAEDLSSWCAVALCNHDFDRSAWKIPKLHWPYFCFAQDRIMPVAKRSAGLFFAGTVANDQTYSARTHLLDDVRARGVPLTIVQPSTNDGNTLFRTAEVASSSEAVLGFGRPGVRGWIDTRVFQYPGAGAILLHDEAHALEPWVHYAPYISGSAESVADAYKRVLALPPGENMAMRERAFKFVQEKHSSVARVKEVLDFLFAEKAR